MNLHENATLFEEVLFEYAEASGIPIFFLEKDYWLTLALQRLSVHTHAELFKVLAIVRSCYAENPIAQLQLKVRHLYDLHLMMNSPVLEGFLESDRLFEILKAVQSDDARNHEFQGDWAQEPLAQALIFQEDAQLWKALESTYTSSFAQLVYGSIPALQDIRASLKALKERLAVFDNTSLAD